jgi:cell division protein FtsB
VPSGTGMSIDTHQDRNMSVPLVLHLVEGILAEVERITVQHAGAQAELTRLSIKVTALEAEMAQLRNRSSRAGEEDSRNLPERFFPN